ncbi:hypothetical protein [Solidesulfovibrio sp.]
MRFPGDRFGRGCLWVSLAALYGLLAMRLFVVWREGLWLEWPLGDFLPDHVVRLVFSLGNDLLLHVAVWLLARDVLYWVAAVCLLLWLLIAPGGPSPAAGQDESSR